MRVLYLSPNGYVGGAERFVLDALWIHKKRGRIQVQALFLNPGEAPESTRGMGIDTFLLPFKMRFSRPWTVLRAVFFLRALLKEQSIDVLHATMPYAHILGALATFGLSVKLVWYQHGPVDGILDQVGMLFPAHRILFNSAYLQECQANLPALWRAPSPQEIVHYGIREVQVSEAECRELRKSLLGPNKKMLWLMAGRICSWKGQDTLLKALGLLAREQKYAPLLQDLRVVLVGKAMLESDKIYAQGLRDLVSKEKLGDIVTFAGHQTHMPLYYRASDVVLHTSKIPEPFGLVAAEAMIQERLVIGSQQGGIREILVHGETGLAYDSVGPKAVLALAEVLGQWLEDWGAGKKSPYEMMARNARDLVRRQFSLESMGQNLEKVYYKVCHKS